MVKRNISGVLLLDKPCGISSNKALQIIKYLYAAEKSGHTGTLDPMATGMLPICLGEATKFSSILLSAPKTYEAVLKLGYRSTTGDLEGEIEKVSDFQALNCSIHDCETVLRQFVGEIQQTPPMYSALKYRGKPLYVYARKGKIIQRNARTIFIYGIKIDSLIGDELKIWVQCGTGTYIRTLAEDIGSALGCGSAYLIKLRRSSVASFDLLKSKTLAAIEEMDVLNRDECLLPIDSLLSDIPLLHLNQEEALHILKGRVLSAKPDAIHFSPSMTNRNIVYDVRLYHQQQFLGLGEVAMNLSLKPKRMMSNSYLSRLNCFTANR
ncbi:MAG: tRNA pseudouridine(55) synthase TruB [Nitrosomonas sp.]|nr:tRNA pseudouridine(55) synthase TruB [Nitrosomonas sp.]MCW5606614.1 tRNA pseudouridine(55) synthase TruB [Nitrosomonas sp.]